MLVIGLLLILIAAAVFVGAIYDGGEDATVEVLGQSFDTTVGGVFVTGAVTMLVFLVGVLFLQASMGRARRKRAERKEAKREQRESVSRLEQERAQLKAENERLSKALTTETPRTRTGSAPTSRTATAPAVGAVAADRGTSTGQPHDDSGHSHDHPSGEDTPARPGLRDRLGLGSTDSASTDSEPAHREGS